MKTKNLLNIIECEEYRGSEDQVITDITQDSRRAAENTVFLAREGFNTDGHEFIDEAYRKGSRVFIVEKFPEVFKPDATYLKVNNSAAVLPAAAAAIHDNPQECLDLYGVTGTNGKTTTCYILYNLLNSLGYKTGLIGTIKADLGDKTLKPSRTTPEASEIYRYLAHMRDAGCEKAVMEVSSHALKLNRIKGLEFTGVIFTNISQDHLDFHKNMDDYLNSKLSLFEQLEKDEGIGLFNKDDEMIYSVFQEASPEIYSFSVNCESDFQAKNIQLSADKSLFELKDKKIEFPMPGRFNIYNAVSSLGLLFLQGFSLEVLSDHLAEFSGVPGRLEKITSSKNFTVLVDYAHTPAGLKNVLQSVSELKYNKLRVVFGCGGDRDKDKRPKMGRAALSYADDVIITTDNPRSEDPQDIINDITAGINFRRYEANWEIIVKRERAIFQAISRANVDDIVIIFGKGHETTQDFGDKVIEFDDREKAIKAIKAKD